MDALTRFSNERIDEMSACWKWTKTASSNYLTREGFSYERFIDSGLLVFLIVEFAC